MLKVFETFSGIGAQAKALSNIGCDYEVVATADWDITAIIAYDLIHNGEPDLSKYEALSKDELYKRVSNLTLSTDGKKPATKKAIKALSKNVLMRLCAAIERTNNLISITDIHGKDLPDGTNLLTYSFPCQDLSIAHAWHGETEGINRGSGNRSSMLWEVERIIKECYLGEAKLPKFLLMENVPAILSAKHKDNFEDWLHSLNEMGYYNKIYRLRSLKFGSLQDRERVYMISVLTNNDAKINKKLDTYFDKNNLEKRKAKARPRMQDVLRINYSIDKYHCEAELSCPNDTPSRRAIYKNNLKIFDGKRYASLVHTITTKQDRHPNSGVIKFSSCRKGASSFRYLTPRECLLLMGFDDSDYENLANNNFYGKNTKNGQFFTYAKMVKLAGNSIVVNVLEDVFRQIVSINDNILK